MGNIQIKKKSLNIANIGNCFRDTASAVSKAFAQFPWRNKEMYAAWLAQQYFLVQHTPRYLCLMAGYLGTDKDESHQTALQHLKEELGHDRLALRDLNSLGYDLANFSSLLETRALIQGQYYWIEHFGPEAHLGYSLLLEYIAAENLSKIQKIVTESFGAKTCSFIRVHATADIEHARDGLKRLQEFPSDIAGYILSNLADSAAFYSQLLNRTAKGEGFNFTWQTAA